MHASFAFGGPRGYFTFFPSLPRGKSAETDHGISSTDGNCRHDDLSLAIARRAVRGWVVYGSQAGAIDQHRLAGNGGITNAASFVSGDLVPGSIAVDHSGNLYIADCTDSRRVDCAAGPPSPEKPKSPGPPVPAKVMGTRI